MSVPEIFLVKQTDLENAKKLLIVCCELYFSIKIVIGNYCELYIK